MSSFPPPSLPLDDSPSLSSPHSPILLNAKIIFTSLVLLILLALLILALHIYAKWFCRRRSRRAPLASWHRRLDSDFDHQDSLKTGLETAIVEALPTFVYRLPPSQKEVLECAVCLCEFQESERGRLLPKCSHSFHTDCIDMWFLSNTTCPLCRTSAEDPSLMRQEQPADTESSSSAAFSSSQIAGQGLHGLEQTGDSLLQPQNGEGHPHPQISVDPSREIVPSRRWSWRSTSDRFSRSQGLQFPTNVLFWGSQSHVISRVSSPLRLEYEQRGARSLPHVAIELPTSQDIFLTPRSASIAPPYCSFTEDLSCPTPARQQPSKLPSARRNSFKRVLSRERKTLSAEQDTSNCGCENGAAMVST